MGYTYKQYGAGFEILGKYEGWHYGIWKDSIPETFVFLKPVNEKDFVFCCLSSIKNGWPDMFCGTLKAGWMKCAVGYFSEISEKETQELLDTKTEA